MSDTPSTDETSGFPGRTAAVRMGVVLLVALFLVLVMAWRDNGRRAALETTAEFTSVGDTHYFPMPEPLPSPPYQAVASLHGEALYPVDYRRHDYPADDMTRLGVDEQGGYIIYKAPDRVKDADERRTGPMFFLKVSPKEYLKMRPKKR